MGWRYTNQRRLPRRARLPHDQDMPAALREVQPSVSRPTNKKEVDPDDRHHHPHRPHRPPSPRQPARERGAAPGDRPRCRGSAGPAAVFWLTPPDPRAPSVEAAYADFTQPAAEAFARHGVERVVGVSALGRGTRWADHAGHITASLAMDDLIASTVVAYRALTNPSFMDNIVRQAESIRNQGLLFSPIDGDRKLPTVATRDIAATAARLLLDTGWSGVDEVPLLGPEDLSFDDMAEIISDELGTRVRFQQTTFE